MVGGQSNNINHDKIRRTILLNCFEPPTACNFSGVFYKKKDEIMKQFFMTMSCIAISLNSFSANAIDIKPFVGGNLAINGVVYSNDAKDATDYMGIDLPDGFFGYGLEAGVKFATDNIYNAAITFAYDYVFSADADINSFMKDYIVCTDIGFSAISATFDNYLRVSKDAKHRQDIVLGLGFGQATERLSIMTTAFGKMNGADDIDEKDKGTIVLLKIGYNYQITNQADWYVNGRFVVPTNSDDVDTLFNASAGVRILF